MATLKHNITGNITQQLLAAGDSVNVSSILLSNIHASNEVTVSLFIQLDSSDSAVDVMIN